MNKKSLIFNLFPMNYSLGKRIGIQCVLINQLFFFGLFAPEQRVLSADNIEGSTSSYVRKIPKSSFYILGSGDIVKIEVTKNSKELNTIFNIDGEGIANLKRLKRVYASGLTIVELTEMLNKEYSKYVKDPDVELTVLGHRPVKIYIDGEVELPGIHVLPGSYSGLQLVDSFNQENTNIDVRKIPNKTFSNTDTDFYNKGSIFFPSLVDAIRKSGGVTPNADLTNIKVVRKNTISNGSGKIKTDINLLSTLNLKDTSNNIRIMDGDTIMVSKSNKPVLSQLSKAIKSNLNPRYINIYVGGQVERNGAMKIRKNASLVEAVAFSGVTDVFQGPVNFLRYNNDGTIDDRKFVLNKKSNRGSYKNPYLKDGDVIYVGKSGFTIATEVIKEITSPVTNIVTTWALYKAVF